MTTSDTFETGDVILITSLDGEASGSALNDGNEYRIQIFDTEQGNVVASGTVELR